MNKSTRCLCEALSNRGASALPEEFLLAVRRALDVGLNCSQISSIIVLAATVAELKDCFEGRGLQERVETLVSVMRGFPRTVIEDGSEDWFRK